METEKYSIAKIKEQGILPLFYHDDITACKQITKALYDAGIRVIEFTNRGPKALENFSQLVQERNQSWPGLLLGIGTIKTASDASAFIDAGADLLISPVFDSSICDVAYLQKILWIPGCMTPSEIHEAAAAGCSMIKLFPGSLLGPGFIEAIRPVFAGLDFVVTGGVETDEANLRSWFAAGAAGVGMGSKLITKTVLEQQDYAVLENKARNLLALVKPWL